MSAEETDRKRILNDIDMFDKFESVVAILRRTDQPIKRLIEIAHSEIIGLKVENVPDEFQDEFGWVLANITSRPEILGDMDNGSAEEILGRTVTLFDTLLRWREENS